MSNLDRKVDELTDVLGEIELGVITEGYTLADAIREGSLVTEQKVGGWRSPDYEKMCALSAAHLAAKTRGIIK